MNFVAIDFETANHLLHSACALGVVFVQNNQIVREYYSLIQPETTFSATNIQVHGIYPEDVEEAPKFPEVWEPLRAFFERGPLVVAHNIPFDQGVLHGCLRYYGLGIPHYLTLDTVKTSRQLLKGRVKNNRLNTLAEYYQIPLNHHDAMDDARACAKILIRQNEEFGDQVIRRFIQGI